MSRESVPDVTTLRKFRRPLLDNDLTKALFEEINAHLAERGPLMRAGTIVDATIIAAPSSTKNAGNARDPEMHQAKKGNAWNFGMKRYRDFRLRLVDRGMHARSRLRYAGNAIRGCAVHRSKSEGLCQYAVAHTANAGPI